MSLTVFVFGLPGSGKSVAARQIKSFARKKHFKPRCFRDYTIGSGQKETGMLEEEEKSGERRKVSWSPSRLIVRIAEAKT